MGTHLRSTPSAGFSLIELLLVVAIIGILGGVAVGITPGIIQTQPRARRGAQQLGAFLKRTREMAISRRRNIEIRVHRAQPGPERRSARCPIRRTRPAPTVARDDATSKAGSSIRQFAGAAATRPISSAPPAPIDPAARRRRTR